MSNLATTNKVPEPRTIHSQLVDLVGNTVEHYRDDLLVHDYSVIERLDHNAFIHVAWVNGTQLYEIPTSIKDDSEIKYLFGTKRPSAIYTGNLDLLETYFAREYFFGYKHFFCYSDGAVVRKVSQSRAVELYKSALDRVIGELRNRNNSGRNVCF